MATPIKFFKVAALPLVPDADAFYYVNDGGDVAEAYVTDSSGNLKQIGNTTMIENLLAIIDGGTFS